MALFSFVRGIHPPHRKKYSEAKPIELFIPKGTMQFPMSQHIGALCSPCVSPKTDVQMGDKIGDSEAFVSAPIYASVNGKTGAAVTSALPNGKRVPAVSLTPDGENPMPADFLETFLSREWASVEPTSYSPEEIVEKVKEAGLVGLGGATFPTHVKLRVNPDKPIDTILLNGCECEPYLTSDHRMMVETPESIILGLQLVMHATGVKKGFIGIEVNKPDAIEAMRKAAQGKPGIEIAECAVQYPMGGERQLIGAVTGRQVPAAPFGLPLDVGCIVTNVATAHSISHAVVHGRPLTHRVVAVTGGGVSKPGNYLVPIGTMLTELLEHCGGVSSARKVLSGGPMMGQAIPDLATPLLKGMGGLTCMREEETSREPESACIRCGRCINNCPLFLAPTKIAQAVKARDFDEAMNLDMIACCECGCCSYVCPARIPVAQYIRTGKDHWRTHSAKK